MDYLRDQYPRPWPPREPPPERGPSDWRFVTGMALGLLLVAMGFGFGILAAAGANTTHGAPGQVAAATDTPSPVATLAPTATVTSTPASTADATATTTPNGTSAGLISGAYLGGIQDAFTSAYGAPSSPYGVPIFAVPQPDGTAAAVSLYGFVAGTDGQQRIDNLSFALNPNEPWTADANYQAAQTLLPPDALYVQDLQDPAQGTIHLYRSTTLATTLPASAFANSQGGPAWPAGTFSVTCNAPGVQLCTIMTGT